MPFRWVLSFWSLAFANKRTGSEPLRPIGLVPLPDIRIISLKIIRPTEMVPLKFLLSHILTPNTVERINLIFAGYCEGTDVEGWKEVDAILDSKRFTALRHVGLCVLFGDSDADQAWLMKLSEQLHSLSSKGILHVHSSKVYHIHS
jgi:hypothetical protein